MNKTMPEGFAQEQAKVIDQRGVQLPIAWVPSESNADGDESAALGRSSRAEGVLTSPNSPTDPNDKLTTEVVNLINSAQETLIISSFLLADDAVEDAIDVAAERQVRVYLLLACEARLDGEVPDDDFSKKCYDQHIAMLQRLAGRVMIHSAPHFHAKVVLADAIGSSVESAKGILLTANLTTEALVRNEELAVQLSGSEIKNMAGLLRWAFFEDAEHQMLDNQNFATVGDAPGVPFPKDFGKVVSTSKHGNSIKDNAMRLILSAQRSIMVSSFGWQEDHEVINALCARAREGIDVTVLARIRSASMDALIKLKEAGAKIHGFEWLHAKAIWIDANEAMVMSANLQEHGLDGGFELGLALSGDRARAVKDALKVFLGRKHKELKTDARLGDVLGEVWLWEDGQLAKDKDAVKVEERKRIAPNLPGVVSDCASDLVGQPEIPEPDWRQHPAHKVEYRWNVVAPTLAKGADEVFQPAETTGADGKGDSGKGDGGKERKEGAKRPYNPRVFKRGGKHSIAILDSAQIDAALKLKAKEFPEANIVFLTGKAN